jgi:hypothetical protein
MGFETVVLDKVATVLKSDNLAGFYCGTLSVVCTAAEANRIAKKLSKELDTKIQISPDGSYGYLFDFVA